MNRMLRLWLVPALCLVAFFPQTFAQTRPSQAASAAAFSAKSYLRGRQLLEAGITALGGLEAIRKAEDVSVRVKGYSYARNQSLRVNQPYDQMTRDEMLFIDLRNRRYIVETLDPLPGGFVFGGRQVIVGQQGYFANPRDKTITPLNLANFNNVGIIRRLPHLLLLAAYEAQPASVRSLGEATFDGRKHNVVSFASSNGILWTLFFDARTNLLSKYEQLLNDNFSGDTVQETIFPGYRIVSDIKVPTARLTKRAGELIEDVKYEEVQFNTRPPESAFARPGGYDEVPQQTGPPPSKETKLGDGVYLFESNVNALVVEFDTYVMVVEPSVGGRGPKPTINKAREMFPGKPVRYVVVTHHHDDHSGGSRSYIANDVTLVTTPANQRYFERMAANTFTLTPDDQSRRPKPVKFEFVNKRRTFTDGKQTVEIIDIGPSPHAQEMLIAYLPKERLVFQGDLVNLSADGKYLPTTINDTTLHFFDSIPRLGLDVRRIASVHGPSTTLEDLREAIEHKRAAK